MKKQTDTKTDDRALDAVVVPATVEDKDPLVPELYDPEANRDEILKPVRSMRTYLRRLLNEDGSYKRKYNQQLKLTAQALMLLEDCYLEIMKAKGELRYVSTETSREGNARKSTSALIKTYIRLDAMARKNLAALGMNMERYARTPGMGDGNDALDALLQDLNH
jgi:hypothetical protein